MTITRRNVMLSAAALAASGCGQTHERGPAFVTVDGQHFRIGADPYRFVGANMWYGAYLGANTSYGSRDRLRAELDTLRTLGVTNLRILGSGELSPLRNSLNPAFRDQTATYNEDLLGGLDFLMAEMAQRGMRAVIYLTNFWEWSGGMATYLYWTNGGEFINMNDPAHPWPAFPDFTSGFYAKEDAVALYHDYVRAVVGRTNTISGIAYKDDPTVMSWQLANEPRPGGSDAVIQANLPAFYAWVTNTAKLIKSLDANHLVSTGSEGLMGCNGSAECVIQEHTPAEIDYLTAHIWPQNWSWANPDDLPGTYPTVEANTRQYITQHVDLARQLNKPLVIEEFGFPRDDGFVPGTPTTYKDRFYGIIYDAVLQSARENGPIAGSNFWAWGGAGRAQHEDLRWATGDTSYVGDPPHEPQGWYSVFDGDASTQGLIRTHAEQLAEATQPA